MLILEKLQNGLKELHSNLVNYNSANLKIKRLDKFKTTKRINTTAKSVTKSSTKNIARSTSSRHAVIFSPKNMYTGIEESNYSSQIDATSINSTTGYFLTIFKIFIFIFFR